MDSKKLKSSIIVTATMFTISLGNYSRLSGTENIRPIHVVVLLTMGAALGVLLVSLVLLIRNKKN